MPWYNAEVFWLCVGFAGQAVFTARFLLQWIASERKGESVVPVAFWYCSLSGGWLLLLYALWRRDPVIITGQMLGVVVYSRNLVLIYRQSRREAVAKSPLAGFSAEMSESELASGVSAVPLAQLRRAA